MLPYRTTPATVPCRECGGDGTLTDSTASRFDTSMGQWYPHDVEVICDACDGFGEEEISVYACGHDVNECACTDDELEALQVVPVR